MRRARWKRKNVRDELTGKAVNSPKTGTGRHELPTELETPLPAALYLNLKSVRRRISGHGAQRGANRTSSASLSAAAPPSCPGRGFQRGGTLPSSPVPLGVGFQRRGPSLVSSKEFDLGIVRCQVLYEPFFLKMIQDEHLDSKVLWQFSPKVLMSPSHPLAGKEPLDHLDFSQSVELLQGDIQYPSFTPENTDCVLPDSDPRHTIYIYDRGSQYEFLRHLPGAYMWTSPVPYSTLTEAKLIQRECTRPDNVFKDLLVCRSNYRLSKAETELTQWLGRTISQLSD